jgi:hypothetical protein
MLQHFSHLNAGVQDGARFRIYHKNYWSCFNSNRDWFCSMGYQLSDSVGSQVTQAITGADTDKVMTYYIFGAVSFIVGVYLFRKN